MNNIEVGRKGEALVASLLPGCSHINSDSEQYGIEDIIWQGIPIDVKTRLINEQSTSAYWTPKNNRDGTGIIYVLVALLDDQAYFWVCHSADRFPYNRRLGTHMTADELPEAILKCKKSIAK